MNKYSYDGPVLEFGERISERWTSETMAPTEAKAKSNLAYQYKKSHSKSSDAKISLPGKITMVGLKEV